MALPSTSGGRFALKCKPETFNAQVGTEFCLYFRAGGARYRICLVVPVQHSFFVEPLGLELDDL